LRKRVERLGILDDRDVIVGGLRKISRTWLLYSQACPTFSCSLEAMQFVHSFLHREGVVLDLHGFPAMPSHDLNQSSFQSLLRFLVISSFLFDPDQMLRHEQMANGMRRE
jgi:hypothetical protein